MKLGFLSGAKRGEHYGMAMDALKRLKTANLLLKYRKEREYEGPIVGRLQNSKKLSKNLNTQIVENEAGKIFKASLFGFTHRPDISICDDGTAIEVKVVSTGKDMRGIIGQAITYRMNYRFVILVIVDISKDRRVVACCKSKNSNEFKLLSCLAENMNIFTIIGPDGPENNIVFKN